MIPYGRQQVTQADVDAVTAVLRSDLITQGPTVPKFERAVCQRVGAAHGVAVNSATSALHIACLALGLGKGDLLWTVPNTFVASANCGRYCGADVDFVDIDPFTWNLSVPALKQKLGHARKTGRLPKVVVPVHFSGQPTDQEEISELAREFGFRVLEDASHSIGAARGGESVGSCRWSDVVVFSFHPVKIVTTAEGGMALTRDEGIASRMRKLRTHGITRDPGDFLQATPPPPAWHYEQQLLGFNYRMTDIHAALGLSQLERLDEYVEIRNRLARRYDDALAGLPLQLPFVRNENRSAFHLYVVRVKANGRADRHRRVFDSLRSSGIGVNLHYLPVHLHPYYRELGFAPGQFPEAESYAEEAISLPLFPTLAPAAQAHVVESLVAALPR